AQTAGRLFARTNVAVPLAAGLPARSGDAVRTLEDEAARRLLDLRRAVRVPLAVNAPPRAKRRQLEPHRPGGCEEPVDDAHGRRAVGGGELAFQHDRADLPTPARDAVREVEGDEELVALRVDRAAAPLVG